MAWARCMKHSLKATEMDCAGHVLPLGHPNTAIICGNDGCEEPGLAWLTRDEAKAHQAGRRIFNLGNEAKVRVGGELAPA